MQNGRSIAGMARLIRWGVVALLVLAIAAHLVALLPDGLRYVRVQMDPLYPNPTPLLRGVGFVGGILFIAALWQLARMLRQIEMTEIFSAGVTRRFRHFAGLMLLSATVSAVVPPLLAMADACIASLSCRPEIRIDIRGLWVVLICTLFFLVARLLDEARRIDEENREII